MGVAQGGVLHQMICSVCHSEAFIHCSLCRVAYCIEHKCEHLGDFEEDYVNEEVGLQNTRSEDVGGNEEGPEHRRHWLSYANILGDMSEAKLREALSRYKLLIKQIEEELVYRTVSSNTCAIPNKSQTRRPTLQTNQPHRSSTMKLYKVLQQITRLSVRQQRLIIEKLEALKNG